jgi:hypothetical protein
VIYIMLHLACLALFLVLVTHDCVHEDEKDLAVGH